MVYFNDTDVEFYSRFPNNARVNTQSADDVSFAFLDKFDFLPECTCVGALAELRDYALAGKSHEDGSPGIGSSTDGKGRQEQSGCLHKG